MLEHNGARADLLIGWGKGLAVATPGRVELYEHIIAREHDVIKGLGCDHLDRPRVVLGRLL